MSIFDVETTKTFVQTIAKTIEEDILRDLNDIISLVKNGVSPTILSGVGNLQFQNTSWKLTSTDLRDLVAYFTLGNLLSQKYLREKEEYEFNITFPGTNFFPLPRQYVITKEWSLDYNLESLQIILRSESLLCQYLIEYRWKLVNTAYKLLIFDETFGSLDLFEAITKYILEMHDSKSYDVQTVESRQIFNLSKRQYAFTITNESRSMVDVQLRGGVIRNLNYYEHNNSILKLYSSNKNLLQSTFKMLINPILKGREICIPQSHPLNILVPETPLDPYENEIAYRKVKKTHNGIQTETTERTILKNNVWFDAKIRINPLKNFVGKRINGVCYLAQGSTNPIEKIEATKDGPSSSVIKIGDFSKIWIRTLPVTSGAISGKPPLPELQINTIDDLFPSVGIFNLYTIESKLTLETLGQKIEDFERIIISKLPLTAEFIQTDVELFEIIQKRKQFGKIALSLGFTTLLQKWDEVKNLWNKFKTNENIHIDELFWFLEQKIWNMLINVFKDSGNRVSKHLILKYMCFFEKKYIIEGKRRKDIRLPENLSDGTYVYEWIRNSDSLSRKDDPRLSWPIPDYITNEDYQYFYYMHPVSTKLEEWNIDATNRNSRRKNLLEFEKREFTHLSLLIWSKSSYEHVEYARTIEFDSTCTELIHNNKSKLKLPCLLWIINRRPISPFESKYLHWTIIKGFKIALK